MNEEKAKVLIQYLNTLSRLDGNYHIEIKLTIAAIEKELGITRAYNEGLNIKMNVNESVLPKNHFTK